MSSIIKSPKNCRQHHSETTPNTHQDHNLKSHIAAILVRLWSLGVMKHLVYTKEEIWTNLAFSQKVKQHDSTIAILYKYPKGVTYLNLHLKTFASKDMGI